MDNAISYVGLQQDKTTLICEVCSLKDFLLAF